MYFKTEILCKFSPAKPALSARATRPPDWCTNMLYVNKCMHPSVANDLATHSNVYNNRIFDKKIYLFLWQNILQLF